jgi:hypothetical protein
MHRTSTQVGFGFILIALALLWWWIDDRRWGLVGSVLGLLSILFLLLNETAYTAGTRYRDEVGGEDTEGKKRAREIAPWLKAVGIPLMFISAWFQLWEILGQRDVFLDPEETVRAEETGGKVRYFVKGDKQLQFNRDVKASTDRIDKAIANLWYPELLVVNCGTTKDCECQPPYEKVKFVKHWNLNAGVSANTSAGVVSDTIVLCIAKTPYPPAS